MRLHPRSRGVRFPIRRPDAPQLEPLFRQRTRIRRARIRNSLGEKCWLLRRGESTSVDVLDCRPRSIIDALQLGHVVCSFNHSSMQSL